MKNSYRYFENRECQYYPCHKDLEHLNCLFCYCPLYNQEECVGTPKYVEQDGKRVKDCSGCEFPHQMENYDTMMECLDALSKKDAR